MNAPACFECHRDAAIFKCLACREDVCAGECGAGKCIEVHLRECPNRAAAALETRLLQGHKHVGVKHECQDCGDLVCESCAGTWDGDCDEHDGMRWYSVDAVCRPCEAVRGHASRKAAAV